MRLSNAEGILALDLALRHDASIAVVAAAGTGIGSDLGVMHGAGQEVDRIAAYGVLPLSGSGPVLTLTVRALQDTGRQMPLSVEAAANEGAISLSVRGSRPDRPERERAR